MQEYTRSASSAYYILSFSSRWVSFSYTESKNNTLLED